MSTPINLKIKSDICSFCTIILTIFVVLAHTTTLFTGTHFFSFKIEQNLILTFITNFFYSFHMPSFISISGSVFYITYIELRKYNGFKKLLVKKSFRLLIPYYFFFIFIVTPIIFKIGILNEDFKFSILKGLVFYGDQRHLWFLPTLFGCMMIFHFCKKLLLKYKLLSIFIALSLKILNDIIFISPIINSIMNYFLFFYIGYCIFAYFDEVYPYLKNPILIISCLLILTLLCMFIQNRGGEIRFSFLILIRLFLNVLGLMFIYGFGTLLSFKYNFLNIPIFHSLKKNSFGIYLFHPMLIYIGAFLIDTSQYNAFMLMTFLFIGSFLISWALTVLVRKIRLGFIIGENPQK